MTKLPAHKNMIDPPGQIINPVPEQTLGQYIARKQQETTEFDECCGNPLRGCIECPPPKKLTFDEWYNRFYVSTPAGRMDIYKHVMRTAWNAGQEN